MKDKARVLHDASKKEVEEKVQVEVVGGTIYRSMKTKLSMLKPEVLEIEDESYKHAGAKHSHKQIG